MARCAVYAYAAPLGLIPCPTLALVTGFALFAGGLVSRTWVVVLGAAGASYALFGALGLGVWIDLALLVGATALLVLGLAARPSRHPGARSAARWAAGSGPP